MRAGVSALAVVATAWIALLLAAPAIAVSGSAESWSGWWVAALYRGAGRICHQQVDRSFLWAGVPYPVCGRCLALYVSGALGLLVAAGAAWTAPGWLSWPRRRSWTVGGRAEVAWLLAAATPAALLFLLEGGGVDPGTSARALGSLPLGVMAGWLAGRELAGPQQ